MNELSATRRNITLAALAFESGLALLALLLGWLLGHWPLVGVELSWQALPEQALAVSWGVLATLPMLAGLWLIQYLPLESLQHLRAVVDRQIVPLFARSNVAEFALLSLAAGLGEELLFRGLLQHGLAVWLDAPAGPWIALVLASLLFGACHWITAAYAVLAALIGLYLGTLLLLSGNLLVPIVAHALYDFLALVYLVRLRRPE